MTIHASSINKYNGRDTSLGAFVPNRVINQEACDLVSILAIVTQAVSAGPITYKASTTPALLSNPLHPRPARLSWSNAAGVIGLVTGVFYGKDFWNNFVSEARTLNAQGHVDTKTSFRSLWAVTISLNGVLNATADVSVGRGFGIGSHERFSDTNLQMGASQTVGVNTLLPISDMNPPNPGNLDILALRNDTSAALITPVTLYGNPYNTIIYGADEAAPADVTVEMQTHFDQMGRA